MEIDLNQCLSISMMFQNAVVYFFAVFGVGAVMGTLRSLWLEPLIGQRAAELVEAPIMFVVILIVGRWISTRCQALSKPSTLALGMLASTLILVADIAVGIGIRGLTLFEVFLNRDPIAGPVYYALVVCVAFAPWAFKQKMANGI